MTTPDTEEAPTPPPPEPAEWVTFPDPPAENKTEPANGKNDTGPSRPVGHWAVAGGSGVVLGGAGLFAAFGPVGLAAGAAAAVGGLGLYGYHRYRRNVGPRSTRQRRDRSRRTTSKVGSTSLGRKGKGPKLFGGGRGSKLGGKSGGPKLGKGGGKLLSGKGGPKLGGKSGGRLLGGKAGKLGSSGKGGLLGSRGRSGKLLGGGRGKGLGGKLGNGRKAAGSKLGSVGKSSGRLLGRGGKAGLGLGKRGGSKLGSAGRSAGRKTVGGLRGAALRTKAGRRTAKGYKAAAKALKSASPDQGRLSRWRQARRAARAKLGGKTWVTRFLAAITSAVLASAAVIGVKRKARQEQPASETEKETSGGKKVTDQTTTDGETPGGPVIPGTVISSEYEPPPTARPAGDTQPSTMRSHMTTQFPLAVAAQQVTAAAAAYKPQTMWDVDHDLEEAHTVPLAIAEAFKLYTMTLQNNYPLHPAIVEALGRAYIALGEVATSMQQTPGLFKQVHADDIRRKTAPRGDESKWNVS